MCAIIAQKGKGKNMNDFMKEVVEVGDEICFFEGKNDKPVAYVWTGKVILCKHKIPLGYARVKSVEDRGKFFLITAEHIVKDVYSYIDYEDFMKALPLHGFKIGYDKTFEANHFDEGVKTEHDIFAYNLQNHVVIVANTFTSGDRMIFNSIDVYCPGLNWANYHRNKLFSSGSGTICNFNLVHGYRLEGLLDWVNKQMEGVTAVWPEKEYPSMWTYEEHESYDEEGNWNLGKRSLEKLFDAPIEVLEVVFKDCNWAKDMIHQIVTAYNGVQ